MDPRLYLAIDNCFAYKRWVKPMDWMRLVRDMGIVWVEQSADTECDPLYMGEGYMAEWVAEVKRASEITGVRIANIYSGHGTYSTCGLAHWHDGVRKRFREEWMKPQARTAQALGAGFGFFAHAFEHNMMQSREAYRTALDRLYDDLADLSSYSGQIGLSSISLEQMYSPHMPPWTIAGTDTLIQEVYARANHPMYITLDIGHMNGQQYFLTPNPEEVRCTLEAARRGENITIPWLGTSHTQEVFRDATLGRLEVAEAMEQIFDGINANPDLFSQPEDCSIWTWVKRLAPYSPIIHLQQSDGKSSPHWPFTKRYNEVGIVRGEDLLASLRYAFSISKEDGMPEPVDAIMLTLEPFVGTAANPYTALDEIAESIRYWRSFLPRDGMKLSETAK